MQMDRRRKLLANLLTVETDEIDRRLQKIYDSRKGNVIPFQRRDG